VVPLSGMTCAVCMRGAVCTYVHGFNDLQGNQSSLNSNNTGAIECVQFVQKGMCYDAECIFSHETAEIYPKDKNPSLL